MRGFIWAFAAVIAASVITVAIRGTAEYMDTRMIVLIRFWVTVFGRRAGVNDVFWSARAGAVFSTQTPYFAGIVYRFGDAFWVLCDSQCPPSRGQCDIFSPPPIFAAILSIFIHGEKIGLRRASAIAVGLFGCADFSTP